MAHKIELGFPVMLPSGGELQTIELRRPIVRDLLAAQRVAQNDPMAAEIALVAAISGQEVSTIENLDLSDYAKIQPVVQNFQARG